MGCRRFPNPLRLTRKLESRSRCCGAILTQLTKLIFPPSRELARLRLRDTTSRNDGLDEVGPGVLNFLLTLDFSPQIRPGQKYVPMNSIECDPAVAIVHRDSPLNLRRFLFPTHSPTVAADISGKSHSAAKPNIRPYPSERVTL